MDFQDKQYIIGIDLGTTNCAVSYVDVAGYKEAVSAQSGKKQPDTPDKGQWIKPFLIPQLTGLGEFTKIPVLPSFLYVPGEYDISKEVLKHPWKKPLDMFAGAFARDHGSKIPARLVSSAKSWLCNAAADRTAKILPWGSQGVEKISPVDATAQYLSHIRSAWNHFVKDEDKFIENQFVVITVPASFNEEARDLTMAGVEKAGLSGAVTLLEEPLAAFYSWLIRHESDWDQQVKADDLIFVCDVGGGTTDFSLISLKAGEQGTPRFERLAVGDHLILGGDNIDLALAKIVESRFPSGTTLTPDKWKTLCHRCREAKERILEKKEKSVRITIKGEGRALISGTLSADLTRGDVEGVLRSRFYPDVASTELKEEDQGREIADFGLPFEKESAVTRHIIRFLENHRDNVRQSLGKDAPLPDFILFNGGTLKPDLVQTRIKEAIRRWFRTSDSFRPRILENPHPDLAVGIGASYYGLVKQGIGVRVGSGSPRSYYLGVGIESGPARSAVCLVERGLDEGSVIDLPDMAFAVRANQPVSFDVYSSSYRSGDTAGSIVPIDDTLTPMAPVQTIIRFGKDGDKKAIPVTMGAEYTEMGTLSMYCHSRVSDHRWKLQFQLRDQAGGLEAAETEVYDDSLIQDACHKVYAVFSDPDGSGLQSVARQVESVVNQGKGSWPLSFLRTLADQLIDAAPLRSQSAAHEARWLNLTGFCMRPGFGDAFDQDRAGKLWKIYLEGPKFEKAVQNRLEWWIFFRRIAAGMKAGQQRQFFQNIAPVLVKSKTKLPPQEEVELWMVAGNLERLLIKDKVRLAKALLPRIKPGKSQDRLLWTLSRLGARDLLYGSVDRVVPPAEAGRWITQIIRHPWKKNDQVHFPVAEMARKTGDRTRDLEPGLADTVIRWLQDQKAPPGLVEMVREKAPRAAADRNQQFGEKLPLGLVLH
ncbi:MAG: Hsp70 family protein [Desulfotignum sp.]|nr:Hsp70 family protein [Desulfotignum sp.]